MFAHQERRLPAYLGMAIALLTILFSGELLGQSREQTRDYTSDEQESAANKNWASVEDAIVMKTNKLRKENSLEAVTVNAELREAATYFANWMANNESYGHQADGNTPAQRAQQHGYDYCIVLENIAYRYRSTGVDKDTLGEKFYTGWRDSPEHRRNMLDAPVTETGVAVAQGKDGVCYGVQMFGRPKSQRISFQIRNESGEKVRYVLQGEGFEKSFELRPRVRRSHRMCRPPQLRLMKSDDDAVVSDLDGKQMVVKSNGEDKLTISKTTDSNTSP